VKPPLSLIYYGAPRPSERDALVAFAGKRSGRAVEWRSAAPPLEDGSPGAVRNAAVAACAGEYVLFVDDRESFETTFVEQACRQLDRRGDVAFVTGWLDGVPEHSDQPPRALTAAMLLGRPWFAHVPTVFRKSAWHDARGFDEQLAGAEDVDLWLRLLARGRAALGVEEPPARSRPWGNSSRPDEAIARALFERHQALFAEHFEAAILGKERAFRQLVAEGELLDERRRKLEGENDQLNEEAARLQGLLARHGGR
jgi:hypothetical protein